MHKVTLLSLAILTLFFLPQTAQARKPSKARSQLFDDTIIKEEEDADRESAKTGIGWPTAVSMNALCASPGIQTFRTISIFRAGWNPKKPNGFDFEKTQQLMGLSTVNVYLDSSKQSQLPCYKELVTISLGTTEKTPRGNFFQLNVKIDENTRAMSMNADEKFVELRKNYPYDYSNSGAYLDVLRKEFSLVPKSFMDLPTGFAIYKVAIELIPSRDPKQRVANGTLDQTGSGLSDALYIEVDGENGLSFSNGMLRTMTKNYYNGSAKTCPSVSEADLDAAVRKGASGDEIYKHFYDAQNPESVCSKAH